LHVNGLPEKLQSGQGRFPSVPGKKERVVSGGIDMLADILLQKLFLHEGEGSGGIQILPGEVIAVAAMQVAGGTHRLAKNLKLP